MIAFYFYLSIEFLFYFQDPNKYLAVLPYEDVYQLFDMVNKFVRPENIPSNAKSSQSSSTFATQLCYGRKILYPKESVTKPFLQKTSPPATLLAPFTAV